jgi:hypothetical protein
MHAPHLGCDSAFIVLTSLSLHRYLHVCNFTHYRTAACLSLHALEDFCLDGFICSGLDCHMQHLVETASIFRVFWAPARVSSGRLASIGIELAHAPESCLLSVQVDADVCSVPSCGTGTVEDFRLVGLASISFDHQTVLVCTPSCYLASVREIYRHGISTFPHFHCLAPSPLRGCSLSTSICLASHHSFAASLLALVS